MTSPCDTCPVPGHCCRSISLNGGSFAKEAETIEEATASIESVQVLGPPLPFRPLFKTAKVGWLWWCPNLDQRTGRCLDYANRPRTCVDYQPGEDRLCVLHEPRSIKPVDSH